MNYTGPESGLYPVNNEAWGLAPGAHAKLLYAVLCGHLHEGDSSPRIDLLAAECSLSRRSVERALVALRASGLITIISGKADPGPNTYRLNPRHSWPNGGGGNGESAEHAG